ncbi:hypothetical protein MLD38_006269 [Melastoma candidum]|uniref:Uncharacterized protein n=1 Tax=Melastoma candidum TaxID=119954 RepID=A0ACB9RM21_9MYRT|nr:hypothetical protein MLD38_006269 [Melastoma candidum]
MPRQKSILSFLQRSSLDNRTSGASNQTVAEARARSWRQDASVPSKDDESAGSMPEMEVRGTDTPPEKEPRRLHQSKEDAGVSSLFSSIMHKFVRVDGCGRLSDGYKKCDDDHKGFHKVNEVMESNYPKKDSISLDIKMNDLDSECLAPAEIVADVPGPETPGVTVFAPRVKSVTEEIPKFDVGNFSSSPNPSKRVKLLQDDNMPTISNKCQDSVSKFEWLHPSRILDAKRRSPDDPLYDKCTLHIPQDALRKMSASQRQYWTVKCQYMDVVLFFKVGKFYELYELDAEIGHKELDWKMTFSGVGKCRQVGISESGIDEAVQKLVAHGYKVGRMEQLESSEQAKARGPNSVISRELVHVITPSTLVDCGIGPDAVHLLAIKEDLCGVNGSQISIGFAFVDCAALRFWTGSITDDASYAALGALLMQVAPKEVIYEATGLSKEAVKAIKKYSSAGTVGVQLTPTVSAAGFSSAIDVNDLIRAKQYFKSSGRVNCVLDNVGFQDIALSALGGLIEHLSRLMLDDVLKNGDISPYELYKGCLRMDGQTLLNLEVFNNSINGGLSGTLLKHLDNCITSSGKRLLRLWMCHPLKDVECINNRLKVVDILVGNPELVVIIGQNLRKLPDLERLLGRVMSSVHSSCSLLMPLIGKKILKNLVKAFGSLVKGLRIALDMVKALWEEVEIRNSLSKIFELPALNGSNGLEDAISQFEAALDSDFPKYQSHDVTDSDAETLSILIELFVEKASEWTAVIHGIGCIDVLRSFTLTAKSSLGSWSKPVIVPHTKTVKGPVLKMTGLWHPFALAENGGLPVPNDLFLGEDSDGSNPCTLLLTGPNMGGKSTLLRATCLAVILAQLGCYVPCEILVLSPVDTIFTRLGATDRIMAGESTFFVECMETASVLQNATEDSLVILDELGRGTSTFDGYAIAYAVFRYLVEKVNCRLLFATHYHPLTSEFGSHPRVKLQHMACTFQKSSGNLETDQQLVFLYQLASGACPESYGLKVASMAGIPTEVVESAMRASQVMKKSIGESFRSSELRSKFSTLHEGWLKSLLSVSKLQDDSDEDTLDTLFCLWHELKGCYS